MALTHLIDRTVLRLPLEPEISSPAESRWLEIGDAAIATSALSLLALQEELVAHPLAIERCGHLFTNRIRVLPADGDLCARIAEWRMADPKHLARASAEDLAAAALAATHRLVLATLEPARYRHCPSWGPSALENWAG